MIPTLTLLISISGGSPDGEALRLGFRREGKPAVGMRVLLWRMKRGDHRASLRMEKEPAVGKTDERGEVAFSRAFQGASIVRLELDLGKGAYLCGHVAAQELKKGMLAVDLPVGKVEGGRVVDAEEGGAIGGVRVRAQAKVSVGKRAWRWEHRCVTDALGRWSVTSPDGSARLTLRSAGYQTVQVELSAASRRPTLVRLFRAYRVRGAVSEKADPYAKTFRVTLQREGARGLDLRSSADFNAGRAGAKGKRGEFSLNSFGRGPHRLTIEFYDAADRKRYGAAISVRVLVSEAMRPIVVRLER